MRNTNSSVVEINSDSAAPAAIQARRGRVRPGQRGKRCFDIALALTLFLLTSPLLIVLAILIRATSKGPALHWSNRVGRENRIFRMPKFRTMRTDTPQFATHLLADAHRYLTPLGSFLRRTSLDELPQLWSILKGDMSLVGPRPALFNQQDLISLRTEEGVHTLFPGLTGWAQINGRDGLPIPVKVKFDYEYLLRQSLGFDLYIMCKTLLKVFKREGVSH